MKRAVGIKTTAPIEALNVTDECAGIVSDVSSGLAFFYLPHTSAALIISEDDEALKADLARVGRDLLAPLRPFRHFRNENPNAEAHIMSSLAGTSVTLPVMDGVLDRGKYQTIMLLELDGPGVREIRSRIIPVQQD